MFTDLPILFFNLHGDADDVICVLNHTTKCLMTDMREQQHESSKHIYHPLVVGSSMGHKHLLLNVSRWDVGHLVTYTVWG